MSNKVAKIYKHKFLGKFPINKQLKKKKKISELN